MFPQRSLASYRLQRKDLSLALLEHELQGEVGQSPVIANYSN